MPRKATKITELPVGPDGLSSGFKLDFGSKITFSGKENKFYRTCFKPESCKPCPLFNQLKIDPDHVEYKSVLGIGEGPGEDEFLEMKPFTGASGKYLRGTEHDTNLTKFGIGHTNIILCEGGKRLEFDDPDLLWKAIDLCTETFLWPEIDDLKPKIVMPMGNLPKTVLLPGERKGIGAVAGCLYLTDGLPYNIIPVHHPAHIVRNPKMHQQFWEELNEVRLYFEQKPGPFVSRRGTLSDIRELVEQDQPIGIDFETTSYHPWDTGQFEALGKNFQYGDIICLSLCVDGLNSFVYTKLDMLRWIKDLKILLESKGVSCHNGQFDILFLNKYNIYPELKDDTMLMSYSTNESPSHPLKGLSRKHLGLEDWSLELEKYPDKVKSYAFIPEEVLMPYCGMDTAAEKQLGFVLLKKMDQDETRLYRDLLIPCANMFRDINYKGIPIDLGRLMELKRKWSKRRLSVVKQLKKYNVRNCNSPYQVSEALIKEEVVDFDAATQKANMLRMAHECEEKGNKRGADLCYLVVEYRELTKAVDTVLYDVASSVCLSDSRIHPDAKLFGTVTGRLVYGNPSLLNFPHATNLSEELRTIFVTDPGNVWGHRDQKQFEMRIYAVVNDDPVLKQIFNAGRDPHQEVGSYHFGSLELRKLGRLSNMSQEEIISFGLPLYLSENEKSRGYTRVAIKATNFGTIYGRGDESIADQWGVSVALAHAFRMTVLEFVPKIKVYWKNVEIVLNRDQVITNPLGRKRRFPIITDGNYHDNLLQAWNFGIQSTANDCNLMGMYEMWKSDYCKHGLLLPFFPVHDAIEDQHSERLSDEIEEWKSEMLAGIPTKVLNATDMKFDTDGQVGFDWAESSLDHYCPTCPRTKLVQSVVHGEEGIINTLWKCQKCGYVQ